MKMNSKKIVMILIIIIIGFFCFKSCTGSIVRLDENKVYQKEHSSGQIDRVFVISSNDIIFSKNLDGKFELAHFHVRGTYATNYFGPIYNVGTFPFGLRIYKDSRGVFKTEIELVDVIGNVNKRTFAENGSRYKSVIIEYDKALKINDDYFNQVEIEPEDIERIRSIFNIK